MTKTLFAGALLALALPVQAQIGIATPATVYGQTFDTLLSTGLTNAWVNDSTLPGWSLFTGAGAPIATYAAGTGSSGTGAFYSFGTTAGDRAFGGMGSGGTYFGSPASGNVAGYIAVAFSNNTSLVLDSFTLLFDGEQWRDGGATQPAIQTMALQFGFGATFGAVTTWNTPGGSFNFVSPVFVSAGSGAIVDGNVAGKVTGLGGTLATTWASGDTLWLRWTERNEIGNDHALAIDNLSFSVTAVPEPGTYALLLAGLGVIGFLARRRRV